MIGNRPLLGHSALVVMPRRTDQPPEEVSKECIDNGQVNGTINVAFDDAQGEFSIKNLFAMRRANGDWYALNDNGGFRVPVFASSSSAMTARMQDPRMECFRPVSIDEAAFKNLTTTDSGSASFWLITDPLLKLSKGSPLNHQELEALLRAHERAVA